MKFRIIHFVMWVFWTLFATTLIWLVGGDFGLTFNKSLTLVVIAFVLQQYFEANVGNDKILKYYQLKAKYEKAVAEELEKARTAKSPEEQQLDDYRRTFGYSEKK